MEKTIAIYPGSFNPIHIGHLNIIQKTERIFGKGNVIIVIGINPDKISPEKRDKYIEDKKLEAHEISKRIDRQVIVYNKFLHELVEDYEKLGYNVVIVRGLRNGSDLDYEVNQMRFINDFKQNINIIFISPDKEFEHISSSSINKIKEFGGMEMIKKYLI
jgi:pantetheine-phosphate adenylyltransferase